ncbi:MULTISPECIES: KorB domain-containing protein [unclassified Xanthomonas]|uniref:ParB/RepB/Spo0J family partition protein n=1 Tax=unclassified Xanthomonas TaxID=2643310 RepID=UPI002A8308C1|nr:MULTISPECIES: KorB domain-containing protein [unclassified Xanthomonas]MDY4296796.1 ParB N-terminal domain-containing protein [Xanthomonas sp. LF02-5]MDY4358445.1 ParB N-terminal domain-containing protein [Xanthomonas sp. LF04-12]
MSAPTFKSMIKDGTAKRADALKFRIEDIHEEPGFNLRDEHAVDADGVSFEENIERLANHIRAGGILPPLEVRPRPEGGVYVVDGYQRRRAWLRAKDDVCDAAGELWLSVVPFLGNDAERTARIITSQHNRKLTMLELGRGYARLAAFGWSPEEIATRVGKTRQHVDQVLILARANSDVQKLVREGVVAPTAAIETVRHHGEDAGGMLAAAVAKAKAAGKHRATTGTIRGKSLPRKIVTALDDVTAQIDKALPDDVRTALQAGEVEHVTLPGELVKQLIEIRERIPSRQERAA